MINKTTVTSLLLLAALTTSVSSSIAVPERKQIAEAPAGSKVKQLSKEEVDHLLAQRVEAGLGFNFAQFANMFLVNSNVMLGQSVGLVTGSEKISKSPLMSPFPQFYKPTLRELLDAIALQTFSDWKYDPSGKYMVNKTRHAAEMAIFEFSEHERKKPYELTMAKGWASSDRGNWTMFSPPIFPVGLDVYEMGTYSSASQSGQAELYKKVPAELALEWAKRVQPKATKEDLKTAKVGTYDAIFFESMVKSQMKKPVHWRQWVFMVGHTCYFIVSSILPENDSKIYPDVEQMLKSFHAQG
jgi:hypothetical protein